MQQWDQSLELLVMSHATTGGAKVTAQILQKCSHCGKRGHLAKDCWQKDPSKKPPPKGGPASKATARPKAKAKPAAKVKGQAKGRGKGCKLREVEVEEPEEAEEAEEPEQEQEDGDQKAMMVESSGMGPWGPQGHRVQRDR